MRCFVSEFYYQISLPLWVLVSGMIRWQLLESDIFNEKIFPTQIRVSQDRSGEKFAEYSQNYAGIIGGSELMWQTLRYLCWEKNTVCRNAEFKLRNDNGLRVDATSLSWSHWEIAEADFFQNIIKYPLIFVAGMIAMMMIFMMMIKWW